MAALEEKVYRKLLDDTYARIDRAFEEVDPDLAEVDVSQGTLTVIYREKLRLILTPQPSPRQLWVAFKDRAWHFDWDAGRGAWMDDRGQGVELGALVESATRDTVGVEVRLARGPQTA
jgi:iron donor protein CyaY